ncbi:phospho-sugar mutase [Alkalibacterium putridalgicola]|uniref:phospho-sugar mutase n=1 Tax=Alkalibacterium putridalgicola TaxID=426703 RepID=UPI0034CE7EEF
MDWERKYNEWQSVVHDHSYITDDLNGLTKEEAQDRFGKHLAFGTGGARGTFGAGINRINHYTVRRITQGFLNYLIKYVKDSKSKGIAISYDTRHYSKEFAENVAYLAASQGFNVYLSDETRPTPLLSYMVRKYKTAGGVMITASHNPPNYNGYKIYDYTGGQMTETMADAIVEELSEVTNELQLENGSFESVISDGNVTLVSDELDDAYLKELEKDLKEPELFKEATDFNVVYTPLHGAGLGIIKKAFESLKFKNYSLVQEQLTVDGTFETVNSPNPEDKEAFAYAEILGKKQQANVIMATDPDADRLGVAVFENDHYTYLTGNQLGAILLSYLIENSNNGALKDSVLIKTIVTSELGAEIARRNDVEVINTLTGFKYIGEVITRMEKSEEKDFLFGYEESYGYLFSSIVRDKDAIQAVVLLLEAALYYHNKNISLIEVLDNLYKEFGYYAEDLVTVKLDSDEQKESIKKNISEFQENLKEGFGDFKLSILEDYSTSERVVLSGSTTTIDLPKSDVLKLIFDDQSWIAIRPSGTEPKYKFYFSAKEVTMEKATTKLENLKDNLFKILL